MVGTGSYEGKTMSEAKIVQHDRLTGRAAGAEGVETAGWAGELLNYFAVMRSMRNNPELWYGGTSNPRERAKAIEQSIRKCKGDILVKRAKFTEELGSQ